MTRVLRHVNAQRQEPREASTFYGPSIGPGAPATPDEAADCEPPSTWRGSTPTANRELKRVLVDLMAWKAFHSEAINERLMIMYATNRLP